MTIKPSSEITEKDKGRFQRMFEKVEDKYSNFLKSAIRRKYVVFGVTLALLGGAVYGWGFVSHELAPQTEADEVRIDFYLSDGMNIAIANQYLEELKERVTAIAPMDQVEYMSTDVRNGRAQVELTMVDQSKRTVSTYALADEIRDKIEGTIPGGEFRVRAQTGLWILRRIFGSGGDEAVQVQLRGHDLMQADEIADEIVQRMERVPAVRGARSDRQEGRPEQNIVFDRDKISEMGLTGRDIADAIQTNVGGSRAGVFREGGDEFSITVRLRDEDRGSTLDLDNISVRTASGATVPVSTVIKQESARGPVSINRINGQRVTYISANLVSGVPLGEAVEDIRAELSDLTLPSGFSIVYGGEYEEQQRAQTDYIISIIMAMILIYMVMAAQFERFLDPIIVMFSVPVAIVGVVPTLLLTGTTMNMQSIMGIIMLIGIVVNNAIVLVDYINLMRRDRKLSVYEAVVQSGKLRLRPILMTTLTTVLALLPLSFGFGAGGEIQASLARVVIGGLIASTMITLVLIPVVYITADKIKVYITEKKAAFMASGDVETVPAE